MVCLFSFAPPATVFLLTAYKYSIPILRVNINLNVFLGQFGPMFIGVKRTWFYP